MKILVNTKLLTVIAVALVTILGAFAANRADTKAEEAEAEAWRTKFITGSMAGEDIRAEVNQLRERLMQQRGAKTPQ